MSSTFVFDLNSSRVIKSMKMRWAGNAAQMNEIRNANKVSVEKPERKEPLWRQA
jgi:hypothetical protein